MSRHRQKRILMSRSTSPVSVAHIMAAKLLLILLALSLLAACARRPVRVVTPLTGLRDIEAPPTYVEIDVSALRHNVEEFKRLLDGKQKLCAVVKTDAYSIGVEQAASAAAAGGADYLCLVYNSEALTIRQMGIGLPIIRVAPGTQEEVTRAVQIGGIEELVGSLEHAQMISQVALSMRNTRGEDFRIPVHINVNTGMTRMAVLHEEDLQKIQDLPGIQVRGLMTHFANASDEELVRQDMEKFDRTVANLKLREPVLIHMAATAATSLFPEARRDMVRIGSGILNARVPEEARDSFDLWPTVVSVKSHVALVMDDVPPGSTVGYGSTYKTDPEKPARLATVRFGHSNGYPSAAGNSGWVLIRGKRFPIVGRLSQNLTVVDITDNNAQDPIRIGDEVVLLGPQGDDRITINELLEWIGESETRRGSEILHLLLISNPKRSVQGVASKLHLRHLYCGLCLDEPQ